MNTGDTREIAVRTSRERRPELQLMLLQILVPIDRAFQFTSGSCVVASCKFRS